MKKLMLGLASVSMAGAALAEGESAGTQFATTIGTAFEGYISSASTALTTLLTAGLVIVGAMFIYRVLKKGLNSSK